MHAVLLPDRVIIIVEGLISQLFIANNIVFAIFNIQEVHIVSLDVLSVQLRV